MCRAHLVECAHSRKAQHRLGAAEEQLQHCDGGRELPSTDAAQIADGPCRLKDDHLTLCHEQSTVPVSMAQALTQVQCLADANELYGKL